jgi:hypothetical protein
MIYLKNSSVLYRNEVVFAGFFGGWAEMGVRRGAGLVRGFVG